MNLIAPGTLYGDRVNEFDFRIAKVLRFGRTRTNVGFDIYNVLNANPVLTYNAAFIPNGELAGPDVGAAVAVREVQRVDRLLSRSAGLKACVPEVLRNTHTVRRCAAAAAAETGCQTASGRIITT